MDKETQANTEIAVMEVAQSGEVHSGKKEEEETSMDGDFIKVEKETFDVKGNSHVAEARAVKSEVRSLTDPKTTDASSREELTSAHNKVKELEIELGRVTNALKNSESENVQVKDQLNQMAKGEEKLNMQLKNLQEDLEIVLTKHMEHSGIKEAFEHLSVELESSKKKMKDLEEGLQSSVSDSRKFEELHIKSAKHLESETKRAEELERLVEATKLSAKEAENQMASLQEEVKSKTVELSAKDSLIDEMYKEIGLVKNSERQLKENTLALESLLSSTQKDHQLKVTELKEIQLKHSEEVSAKKSIAQALEAQEELAKVSAAKKDGLEAALEQMKRTCGELETKLKLSYEEFGKADAFSAQVTIKNAELEHKMKFFKQIVSESKSSEASAVQKNKELEEQLTLLESQHVDTDRDLKGLIESLNVTTEEKRKSEEALHDTMAKLKEAENLLEGAKARTAEFESLNATLIKDSDLKLQEHVKSFTNKESEMKSSCENLELLIEFQKKAYEDKLAEAASKAATLSEELDQAYTKGAYLKRMMDEAEKRAAQSLSENELLAETNSQLKSKVRESSEIVESRKVELDQTNVKVLDQQKHIEELETKLAQLETNIGALGEANIKLNEELAAFELYKALAEKNNKYSSERQRLQTEGDEAEVRSRDIGLDFSSPTKGKSKKSESSSTQTPSASAETKAKTIEAPSSLNNLQLVIGVAIISIIIGLILGKRY